jgi:glyoxylase-like metal-dependent hydrolase (beta-lactamase superfamily II)
MVRICNQDPLILNLELPMNNIAPGYTYFVVSGEEVLVIDPPIYKPRFIAQYHEAVGELARGKKVSVFFTQTHGELAKRRPVLPETDGAIYMTRGEYEDLSTHHRSSYKKTRFKKEGFPAEEIDALFSKKPEKTEECGQKICFVKDGMMISVGDLTLECIITPGPSKEHCCLYLEESRILFSGALLPAQGLPDADIWNDKRSSLDALLGSLETLRERKVDCVFPFYGESFTDCTKRIDEIIAQYYMRLVEMYQLVHDSPGKSAYELSRQFGHRKGRNEHIAVKNRWFAMKASLACLTMLRSNRYVSARRGESCLMNYPGTTRFADVIGDHIN